MYILLLLLYCFSILLCRFLAIFTTWLYDGPIRQGTGEIMFNDEIWGITFYLENDSGGNCMINKNDLYDIE